MNIPEGWKLVPLKADEGMIRAGCGEGDDLHDSAFVRAYDAALSAAPTPPAQDVVCKDPSAMCGEVGCPNDFEECAASGENHRYRADGPNGEIQCEWCGEAPPDATDGHDHEGFAGGCERAGHTVETCLTPPEVEPFGYVTNNGWFYTVDDAHRCLTKEQRDFVFTKVYTSPPSPKAEYSPDGDPLNLRAAAKDALGYIEGGDDSEEALAKMVRRNLRKFLGDGS